MAPIAGAEGVLGIPPFAVAARDSALAPLGFAFADFLATDLSRSARVQLVERARLGEVLRELDLAAAGRVDSATAPRVGRILQARRLLVGSIGTAPGDRNTLRLGVRVADVPTGVLAQTIDARAPLDDVLAAEKALVLRIFDALGVVLAPSERARRRGAADREPRRPARLRARRAAPARRRLPRRAGRVPPGAPPRSQLPRRARARRAGARPVGVGRDGQPGVGARRARGRRRRRRRARSAEPAARPAHLRRAQRRQRR
jgi:hypothetical protein